MLSVDLDTDIRTAFASAAVPRAEDLLRSGVRPDFDDPCDDHAHTYRFFENKHWSEVPCERIGYDTDLVTFLSMRAFVYYLPAIMSCINKDIEKSQNLLMTFEFYYCAAVIQLVEGIKDGDYDDREKTKERLSLLDNAQKRVVAKFIKIVMGHECPAGPEDYDVRYLALKLYWGAYLA